MAELMTKTNQPTDSLNDAYTKWSEGGWGSILTGTPHQTLQPAIYTKARQLTQSQGNIQVDIDHLGSPFDPALHGEYTGTDTALIAQWKSYADACQKHGTPALAQICHPGRQSFRVAGRRGMFASTIAPSAVPIHVGDGLLERVIAAVAWTQPREMTRADIEKTIRCFVDTARLMADAGFKGVELHGAHGYLIGMIVLFIILSFFTNYRLEYVVMLTIYPDQFLNSKVT